MAETFTLFTRAVIGKLQNHIVLSTLDEFEPSKTRQEHGLPSWVLEYFNREIISTVIDIPDLLSDFAAYWKIRYGDFSDLPLQSALCKSHKHLMVLAATGHAGKFGRRVFYTCHQRSFLVTEQSLLALVPRRTRSGDFIMVFEGANVPHVIRMISPDGGGYNIESSVPKFELIGECYVHGRMQGSAVDELDMGNFEALMFHLC